jgi:hypothetical protein
MGPQRKLVYSFVARGSAVLADHAEASGNFATVAAECLQKLPASNNRFSYNCDGHTFNYHVHDGFSNVPDLDVPCFSSCFFISSACACGLFDKILLLFEDGGVTYGLRFQYPCIIPVDWNVDISLLCFLS